MTSEEKFAAIFILVWVALILFLPIAHSAEIPLPPLRPYQPCLSPNVNPKPFQVLQIDASCKSGLRWVNPGHK